MYIPRPFQVSPEEARDLLREITVGHLITTTSQGPIATLLPWVVDDENLALVGHMARPNAQWQTQWQGQALVIAEGPNGYVSPSWYATKAETGLVVPTWDYVVVHAYGELVIHDEGTWVDEVVRRLTDRHEQQRREPWSVDDAPSDYIDSQLRGIVGVEVQIDRVEASVKMSQNKSDADRSGVLAGFVGDGNGPVAEWIERATT
jgi:transcriptional regulator